MVVARHSQNHIEKPAKAIITAANKGKDARSEREQLSSPLNRATWL